MGLVPVGVDRCGSGRLKQLELQEEAAAGRKRRDIVIEMALMAKPSSGASLPWAYEID
jgi:hypothetical protein